PIPYGHDLVIDTVKVIRDGNTRAEYDDFRGVREPESRWNVQRPAVPGQMGDEDDEHAEAAEEIEARIAGTDLSGCCGHDGTGSGMCGGCECRIARRSASGFRRARPSAAPPASRWPLSACVLRSQAARWRSGRRRRAATGARSTAVRPHWQ